MKITDLQIFKLNQTYPHGKTIDAVLVFIKTDEGFVGFGSSHHPIPDEFIDAMIEIAELSEKDPDEIKNTPKNAPIARPDETKAARDLKLTYKL